MADKLYAEYGNAGHKFPRTTKEAFGRDENVYLETDCEDDYVVLPSWEFVIAVYTTAAVVVLLLWWNP